MTLRLPRHRGKGWIPVGIYDAVSTTDEIRRVRVPANFGYVGGQPGDVPKTNKFNARKHDLDGHRFDSGHECRRYVHLKHLQTIGEIRDLEVHPKYEFAVNGQKVGTMKPDFRYVVVKTGTTIVEDAKSGPTRTEAYQLRKKLLKACHGIDLVEV